MLNEIAFCSAIPTSINCLPAFFLLDSLKPIHKGVEAATTTTLGSFFILLSKNSDAIFP